MITAIKKWLNKGKIEQQETDARFQRIEEAISAKEAELEAVKSQLEATTEELNVFRKQEEADKEKYNSVEPWIEIKSDGIDPIKGMVIECDWNPAFIQFLKENGITAKDENVAVQKYIAMLYEDIVNKMEQQIVDNSDKKPKVSDFA